MSAKKIHDQTSRIADTLGTKINRAETGRVISSFFRAVSQEFTDLEAITFLLNEYRKTKNKALLAKKVKK